MADNSLPFKTMGRITKMYNDDKKITNLKVGLVVIGSHIVCLSINKVLILPSIYSKKKMLNLTVTRCLGSYY